MIGDILKVLAIGAAGAGVYVLYQKQQEEKNRVNPEAELEQELEERLAFLEGRDRYLSLPREER